MQQEILSAQRFFNEEVPKLLDQLKADTQPAWGLMTPQHMVEHLIVTYKMAIGRIKIPLAISEEKAERNKPYLIQDSPMRRSVPSPTGNNNLQPLRSNSLKEAVEKFKMEISNFNEFIKTHPDHLRRAAAGRRRLLPGQCAYRNNGARRGFTRNTETAGLGLREWRRRRGIGVRPGLLWEVGRCPEK